MKYTAPYGSPDPNASYQDRNTPGAISGSRVPAAAIEQPMREIEAVIIAAGLLPTSTDLTQLLQALRLIINEVTGGAGDENYVLMTQARSRLPIFPEVLTSDGRLPIVSPSTGTVRVPAGYNFLHRGLFNVTTVQEDFATAANKTYHLRWTTAGFALRDVGDSGYNPSALGEAIEAFDSTYDNMLVARVVTNASNVATITALSNKSRLSIEGEVTIQATGFGGADQTPVTLNWARRPLAATRSFGAILDSNTISNNECDWGTVVNNRYSIGCFYRRTSQVGDGGVIHYTAWMQ